MVALLRVCTIGIKIILVARHTRDGRCLSDRVFDMSDLVALIEQPEAPRREATKGTSQMRHDA